MIIKNKFFVGLTIALAIFATAVFGIVALNDVSETGDITFDGSQVVFSGPYDASVSIDGATVEYVSTPAVMQMRYDGVVSETTLQGNFKMQDQDDACFAALLSRDADYIKITNDEEVYIFNFETAAETAAFYTELLK